MEVVDLVGILPTSLQNEDFPMDQRKALISDLRIAFVKSKDNKVRVDSYQDLGKRIVMAKYMVEKVNNNKETIDSLEDVEFRLIEI